MPACKFKLQLTVEGAVKHGRRSLAEADAKGLSRLATPPLHGGQNGHGSAASLPGKRSIQKIFPGEFDKGKWYGKIMALGVRQTLRGRRWRASALWKTLNEVASPCSLTICRPVVSSQNSGFRIRDRRRWHLSFPYHWNQSRELCEQCNWRQNRGTMIGNRRCKMLAIMSLRM